MKKNWTNIGRILEGLWKDIGMSLEQYWSNIGMTMEQEWNNIGKKWNNIGIRTILFERENKHPKESFYFGPFLNKKPD